MRYGCPLVVVFLAASVGTPGCNSSKTESVADTGQSARCTLPDGSCHANCRVDSELYDPVRQCWRPSEILACSDELFNSSCSGPFCWTRTDTKEIRRNRCRSPLVPRDAPWQTCAESEARLMDEKSRCGS